MHQAINALMCRRPFVPFFIKTSDGLVYEVDHAEFLAQSRDGKTISYYLAEDNRLVIIDTAQVLDVSIKTAG